MKRLPTMTVIVVAGWLGAGNAQATTVDVASLENPYRVEPARVDIVVGDSVRWISDQTVIPHPLVSQAGPWSFQYRAQPGAAPSEYTFTAPGEYSYFCRLHEGMDGVIVVKAPDVLPGPVDPAEPPPSTAADTGGGTETVGGRTSPTPSIDPTPLPRLLANLTSAPAALETGDSYPPRMAWVRVAGSAGTVRVDLAVNEPARVRLRLMRRRATRIVRTLRVRRGASAFSVHSPRLRAGRWRWQLSLTDAHENATAARGVVVVRAPGHRHG